MKEPHEWNEAYVLNILSSNENDHLEFKGRAMIDLTMSKITDINRDGLAKAISAFANSGGGNIILGINDRTHQVDEGGIDISIKNGTRSWLEDLLPNLVDPPLQKMNVHEILKTNPDSQLLENRALYVIEIGDSPIAPHQSCCDNKYYGRIAGKSHPLSNRMVLDILGRRQFPNIEISFYYAYIDEDNPNLHRREGNHTVLNVQLKNNGPVFARFVNVIIYLPKYLYPINATKNVFNESIIQINHINYVQIIRENVVLENFTLDGRIESKGWGRYSPILPGRISSFDIPLVDRFEDHKNSFVNTTPVLYWELYADNAPCKKGERSLFFITKNPNL